MMVDMDPTRSHECRTLPFQNSLPQYYIVVGGFLNTVICHNQLLECQCQPQESTLFGLLFFGPGLCFLSLLALVIVWSFSAVRHLLISFILYLYPVFSVFGCCIIVCSPLFLWVPLWITFYVFYSFPSVDYFLDSINKAAIGSILFWEFFVTE